MEPQINVFVDVQLHHVFNGNILSNIRLFSDSNGFGKTCPQIGPELAGPEPARISLGHPRQAEAGQQGWANEDRLGKPVPSLIRNMSRQARPDQGDNQAGPGSVRPGPGLARARDRLGPGQNRS